jgi:LPS-assembly protein
MDEVTYTTCPGDEPDWLLKIDELRVYNEKGIGEAERVSLRFMDVPLFYWPYLSFPISDARKSGFLVPEFGQYERSGLEIKIPYYFNLAPNYDYTVAPTWLSKRGLQLANDFRYLGRQGGGEVEFDYLHQDDRRPEDGQRSYFRLDHVTRRDNGWRFAADIEDVSDTDYFQDLGSGVAITSQTHLERAVQAEHTGSVWRVLARAQNFRTLDLSIPEDQRPYARLPQLLATAFWREGVLGLDWRLRSEVANFSRNVGEEGIRVHLEPSASWPVEGPGYFFVPSASMRFVNYQLTNRDPDLDDSPDMAVPTLSLDSGLVFERDVAGNDFVQTLEPRLLYAWIPVRDQDELPVFDTGVPDFNFVQLFRANRFIGADRIGARLGKGLDLQWTPPASRAALHDRGRGSRRRDK